ncbi:hypothetical protein N752_18850 [Desulforamulus aquiferis]|nr:hypothetical protein [Desulforamulus aquiferis]RYD03634.1 hypothetical protein N752_18850 [Desulforamulus aquiferis]
MREKVIQEKGQQADKYYQELESHRAEFNKYKAEFKYYLKDTSTGETFTNLEAANDAEANRLLSNKDMLYVRSYPSVRQGYLSTEGRRLVYLQYGSSVAPLEVNKNKVFEGVIAVPKTAPAAGMVLGSFHDYQRSQMLYFLFVLSSIGALG